MLLNLSDVLSEQHTRIVEEVFIEMETFEKDGVRCPLVKKTPLSICVEHVKNHEIRITGKAKIVTLIPCDRCLEPVEVEQNLEFVKLVDLDEAEDAQTEDFDESNYIDGYTLDVDLLVCNEMLIGWPTKILCSDDCKGICSTCGQNLNHGSCDCESTSLDPRMSVIRDVFKNFKEV